MISLSLFIIKKNMILFEKFFFSIFQFSYLFLCIYYMLNPIQINTELEYYSFLISIFLYIIYTMMDLFLSHFIYYKVVFLFLIFNSFLFEILAVIQYQYSANLFNIFLWSYCIFDIFKYSYLFLDNSVIVEPFEFTLFND